MYNLKYIAEFKDSFDNHYIIKFLKNNYTGNVFELNPTSLIIEYIDSDIFETLKGAGCTIGLISSTDRQLIDLYTADYKDWQVYITKNDIVYFTGYVESELYNETFSESNNYPVEIQCNNGIGVLNREKYIKSDNTQYKGLTNIYDVIINCLNKIGITYNTINIATNININNYIVPNNKSILQYLTVNNDNFIDEDGIVMSVKEVLNSILSPLNLSLFIEGDDIWIVDFENLKNETIEYRSFNWGSDVCTIYTKNIVKDLNNTIQLDSSFDIKAGINNYIINKNRYVKNIISKVDFNESYEGEKYGDVWELSNNTILSDSYNNKGTERRLWMHKLDSFSDYYINGGTLPNQGTYDYFNLNHNELAFAGGLKNIKIVDGTVINYDNDDRNFENYIIINNPYKDYWNSNKVTDLLYTPINHFDYDLSTIANKVANYTVKSPFIFNSTESLINLNLKAQFISTGIAAPAGSYGEFKWLNVDEMFDSYGIFLYYTKVLFKDINGNIKYFLRLKNSENYNKTSEIPLPENSIYELVEYTGQTNTYCLIYIYDINDAGNQQNIINKDIEVNINIPVNFDSFFLLDFELYNMWFRASDKKYDDMGNEIQLNYLQPAADFKESIPHLAIKDIYTKIVNKETGEEYELNDDEIQYSLSEQYKTEKIEDELTNYTADQRYITDIAGVTLNNDYIRLVSNNSYSKSDLEDFKAEKIINQYKNNNINLNMTIQDDDASLLSLFMLPNDQIWHNKKWVASSISNNIVNNQITLNLKEIF